MFSSPSNKYEKIKKNKKITIGIKKDYPPLHYYKGNQIKGVEKKMIESLSNFLEASIDLVEISLGNAIPLLINQKIDIAIAGISRSLNRAKKITYTKPYIITYPAIIVSKRSLPQQEYGDTIESEKVSSIVNLNRIAHFKILIQKYSVYEEIVKEYFPNIQPILVDNHKTAISLLKQKKADAFLHDSILIEFLQNNDSYLHNNFTVILDKKREEYICVVLNISDLILKNQLDIWITELIRTGKIKNWLY